jgi:hypothetical protein
MAQAAVPLAQGSTGTASASSSRAAGGMANRCAEHLWDVIEVVCGANAADVDAVVDALAARKAQGTRGGPLTALAALNGRTLGATSSSAAQARQQSRGSTAGGVSAAAGRTAQPQSLTVTPPAHNEVPSRHESSGRRPKRSRQAATGQATDTGHLEASTISALLASAGMVGPDSGRHDAARDLSSTASSLLLQHLLPDPAQPSSMAPTQ